MIILCTKSITLFFVHIISPLNKTHGKQKYVFFVKPTIFKIYILIKLSRSPFWIWTARSRSICFEFSKSGRGLPKCFISSFSSRGYLEKGLFKRLFNTFSSIVSNTQLMFASIHFTTSANLLPKLLYQEAHKINSYHT